MNGPSVQHNSYLTQTQPCHSTLTEAEKEASAKASSGKSGKMSKMGKAGSMPMSVSSKAASAKSAKGSGYHLFPKSAKAHSMPHSMPGSSWGGSRR